MKNSDVDEQKAIAGNYCHKQHSGCFCAVGYPYERQCERCRDSRPKDEDRDWCWYGGCCWADAELKSIRLNQKD